MEGATARWRLSPAYDLNPVPTDIRPGGFTTRIDLDDETASLKLAYDVVSYFEHRLAEARTMARDVGNSVGSWRKEAARFDVSKSEIDRMTSAFEHNHFECGSGRQMKTNA